MLSARNHRKLVLFAALLLLSFLFYSIRSVSAAGTYQDGVIGEGVVITDDVFLNAQQITISGTVDGLLIAIGQEISVSASAELGNDVVLIAQYVNIEEGAAFQGNILILAQATGLNTTLPQNLYAAGAQLSLGSSAVIHRNLFFAGFQIETTPGSVVEDNLYAAGYQSLLAGSIQRNLRLASPAVELDGNIRGDAEIQLDLWNLNEDSVRFWMPYLENLGIPDPLPAGLRVGDNAQINGRLIYSSFNVIEDTFNINPSGGIIFRTPQPEGNIASPGAAANTNRTDPLLNRFLRSIRLFVSLAICGLLALWVIPVYFKKSALQVYIKPLNSLGIGLISIISVYIGLFVLLVFFMLAMALFDLITIGPLGRSLFGVGAIGLLMVFLVYNLVVAYFSKLVVAYWAGDLITGWLKLSAGKSDVFTLGLGILLFVLLNAIPHVGWIISVVVTLLGLGAMWYVLQTHSRFSFLKWKS